MANVNITVWDNAASVATGNPLQYLTAAIDGSASAVISGVGRNPRTCRLYAESDVWVAFGENPNPTGAGDAIAMGADNPEYFSIEAGHKVKAITRA